MKIKKLFLIGIGIAFCVAFLDLLSKRVVFAILEEVALKESVANPYIEIFNFFNLVYVWNRGVSFGMFNQLENAQIILSVTQLSIAAILCFWLYYNEKTIVTWALGLIIGGAFGNAIDRINNAAVADFLDFHVASYHWPAFNLADSFVFIGVAILIFDDFILKKK